MLNEGLYEQVISKALSSELENPEQIVDTNKIDNAEAPAILAKYIAEVVEKGLRHLKFFWKIERHCPKTVSILSFLFCL